MSSFRISTTVLSDDPSAAAAERTRSLCFFLGFSAMNSNAVRALPASQAGAGASCAVESIVVVEQRRELGRLRFLAECFLHLADEAIACRSRCKGHGALLPGRLFSG